MEKLWAPWRMAYVGKSNEPTSGCIFCTKPEEDRDEENYLVHRGETMFIMLNAFPYNTGHLMIVPYRHLADMRDLNPEELLEWMTLSQRALSALEAAFKPEAYNLGINLGRPAGAGIADHVHLHIVPRWNGDTNFMPVIGDVKVLPEALEQSYHKLKAAFR
ncbi:MAG: HIT domain-containing protein [Armatimonadetes bacterium]|nr:HIT domain-containing protein [Armatimonadota bacterium]